jgi:hypothetical protein
MRRRARFAVVVSLLAVSPASAQPPFRQVDFERVATIGVLDGAEQYTFGTIHTAELLPNRTVAVSDILSANVRIFDFAGRHVRTVGGRGAGPGEFQNPTRIVVRNADFLVFDGRLRRYSRFAFDGRHLGELREEEARLRHGHWLSDLRPGINSGMAAALQANSRAVLPEMRAGLVAGRDGSTRQDTLVSVRDGTIFYVSQQGRFGIVPRGFGYGVIWAQQGDSIVGVADAIAGAVTIYRAAASGLEVVRRVRLGVPPRPVQASDVRAIEQQTRAEMPAVLPPNITFISPPYSAQFHVGLFDEGGNFWLRRREHRGLSPHNDWVVVPRVGAPFQVRVPTGLRIASIRGGMVAGVVRDEYDVSYVHLYRLRWR